MADPEVQPGRAEFIHEAQQARSGLLREMVGFLRHYRNWWLVPIVVMLLGVGLIAVLGGTAIAPLIYTLF